jgi:hypothetical protein
VPLPRLPAKKLSANATKPSARDGQADDSPSSVRADPPIASSVGRGDSRIAPLATSAPPAGFTAFPVSAETSRAQSIARITKFGSSGARTIYNLTIPPGNTRLRTQRSSGDGPASVACAPRNPRHNRIF